MRSHRDTHRIINAATTLARGIDHSGPPTTRRGVTLVELLVVAFVVSVLLLISVPVIRNFKVKQDDLLNIRNLGATMKDPVNGPTISMASLPPGEHAQLIARCAEIARDPDDPQGHSLVLATLAWLARPENAALLKTPEAAALAAALTENKVVPPEAFGSLDTLLLSAPMTPEQRSDLAFRYIVEQRVDAGTLGSDVPLALLPPQLDALQRMLAGWDGLPEHFPWLALDALVAAGHQPALPLVKEWEERVAPKPDRGSQLVSRALRQGVMLLEAGRDPARLLAVGAQIDMETRARLWAFKRAHDLGASDHQIRAAIESLHAAAIDDARARNLNAWDTRVWVTGPLDEVVMFAKRIGALDEDAYPDLITLPSHTLHNHRRRRGLPSNFPGLMRMCWVRPSGVIPSPRAPPLRHQHPQGLRHPRHPRRGLHVPRSGRAHRPRRAQRAGKVHPPAHHGGR